MQTGDCRGSFIIDTSVRFRSSWTAI